MFYALRAAEPVLKGIDDCLVHLHTSQQQTGENDLALSDPRPVVQLSRVSAALCHSTMHIYCSNKAF